MTGLLVQMAVAKREMRNYCPDAGASSWMLSSPGKGGRNARYPAAPRIGTKATIQKMRASFKPLHRTGSISNRRAAGEPENDYDSVASIY